MSHRRTRHAFTGPQNYEICHTSPVASGATIARVRSIDDYEGSKNLSSHKMNSPNGMFHKGGYPEMDGLCWNPITMDDLVPPFRNLPNVYLGSSIPAFLKSLSWQAFLLRRGSLCANDPKEKTEQKLSECISRDCVKHSSFAADLVWTHTKNHPVSSHVTAHISSM